MARLEAEAAAAGVSTSEWTKQLLLKHLRSNTAGTSSATPPPVAPVTPQSQTSASVEALHDEIICLRDDVQKALSLALTRGLSGGEADAIAEMLHELFRGRSTE